MSGHIPGDGIIVVDTRRRWSAEERQRALEDTKSASVSSVARKHGVGLSLLFLYGVYDFKFDLIERLVVCCRYVPTTTICA